jgi:hypothetical protein
MALQEGEKLQSLVLLSPAVFRPEQRPPTATPQEWRKVMHAHPERFPLLPNNPEVELKQEKLVRRLIGPPRDAAREDRLPGLFVPTSWCLEPRTNSPRRKWRASIASTMVRRISC